MITRQGRDELTYMRTHKTPDIPNRYSKQVFSRLMLRTTFSESSPDMHAATCSPLLIGQVVVVGCSIAAASLSSTATATAALAASGVVVVVMMMLRGHYLQGQQLQACEAACQGQQQAGAAGCQQPVSQGEVQCRQLRQLRGDGLDKRRHLQQQQQDPVIIQQ